MRSCSWSLSTRAESHVPGQMALQVMLPFCAISKPTVLERPASCQCQA